MASAARIRSLARHSAESLELISFVCRSAVLPLPRLAALAEMLLSQRQMGSDPLLPGLDPAGGAALLRLSSRSGPALQGHSPTPCGNWPQPLPVATPLPAGPFVRQCGIDLLLDEALGHGNRGLEIKQPGQKKADLSVRPCERPVQKLPSLALHSGVLLPPWVYSLASPLRARACG
jgi:hypothetical protein